MRDLGTLRRWESSAVAINNRGQIIGTIRATPEEDDKHAVLWTFKP